jgi:hypothetical protein
MAWRQLTKLFLRQFLENDLVSPDSDRAQLLAVVGAGVVSLTLFASMFLSAGYAMSVLTPGQAAVMTLNDKFFYVSMAMLITALVAAAQWDALSLDHRDSAILDPLPVPPSIIRWAKLTAVAMFGAAVALAVNAFPTFVFPWMVSFSLRQMAASDVFRMMAIHAAITVSAAAFGYLAVMAVRESLSAVLGPKLFTRYSPTFQASAIVLLGSLLFLVPPASTRVAQRGFSGWRAQLPPMAFVGAYEEVSNNFIADLPRRQMNVRMAAHDREGAALYEQRRPLLPALARRVEVLFGGVIAILLAASIVSALRAPVGGALLVTGERHRSRVSEWIANAVIVRNQAARAGFYFAIATLFRSKTHRLTLACAAAIGLSMSLVVLSRTNLEEGALRPGILSVQPLLYGCLLAAFRHLVRVPPELRANWGVRLAWRSQRRAFTDGVCRAAMLTLAVPAIALVFLPMAIVAGAPMALAHAALGVAGAAILLEAMMLGYDKAPFTCNYVPIESAKGVVPLYAIAFLIGVSLFARVELAILTAANPLRGILFLAILFAVLRIAALRQRELPVDFDEAPPALQTLGLHT